MREERDVRRHWSLRRFLVHFWEDDRRRNDALWWALTSLFIGALALAFRAPAAAHAQGVSTSARRRELPSQITPRSYAAPSPVQASSESQADSQQPDPDIEPAPETPSDSQVQTPSPAPSVLAILPSGATERPSFAPPDPPAPKGRARRYVLGEVTPRMSMVWVGSSAQQPTYTTTIDSVTFKAPDPAASPWFVHQTAGNSPARVAAGFQLSAPASVSSPAPGDSGGGEPSLGDTPPSVGGVNPAPEPGSLTLLLLTSGVLFIRRRPRQAF